MAKSAIGQAVKLTRQKSGKTALEVASELPADHTTVFRYESSGKIRPDVIVRLSEVLESPGLLSQYCNQCPVAQAQKKERAALKAAR